MTIAWNLRRRCSQNHERKYAFNQNDFLARKFYYIIELKRFVISKFSQMKQNQNITPTFRYPDERLNSAANLFLEFVAIFHGRGIFFIGVS